MGYLTSDQETPLTAEQLRNNAPVANKAGMLPNGMASPVNPNQSTANLSQLARNKESAYLTGDPEAERIKLLRSVDPSKVDASWVKGFELGQANKRANKNMDMMGEQLAWKRTDRMEKRQIDDGMRQAAEAGGYEGVIDFLKVADPDRAIEFNSKKIALDQGMMKSDIMQTLLPVEQAKAMVEGYGVLGKMGMALMNARPQDRQNMYQTMLPLIQKVNPDAPKDLLQAIPMFMLGIAQATPANIMFKAQNDVSESTSRIGRLSKDIDIRMKAGYDPKTDSGLQAMMAELEKSKIGLQQANLSLNNMQINQGIKGQTLDRQVIMANESFNKNLLNESKSFIDHVDLYSQAKGYIERLKADPTSSYDQIGLARTYGMGLNKGAYSEADNAITFAAYGVPELKKKIDAMLSGQKVSLNGMEQSALIKTVEGNMQQALKVQEQTELGYEKSATSEQYSKIVSWKDVRKPSEKYYSLVNPQKENDIIPTINGKTASPDDIAAAAKDPKIMQDFIQYYGYDPTKPPQPQGGQR